jgi:hypothetical protein
VLYRGQSVFDMSGADAVALAYFRHGMVPFEANGDDTNNERRSLVIPLMMGRFPYDPQSCFPASRRGELQMQVQVDVAVTGGDGLRLAAETIEILGANPTEYERKSVITRTFAATGKNNFDLPIGHKFRGALLFGTTPFAGASPAPSWGRVELLKDNRQVAFASSDWEVLHQMHMLMGRQPPTGQAHFHRTDATAAVTTQTTLAGPHGEGNQDGWNQYAYLDCDPTRDDTFSIDTAGANDFMIKADVETADAVRCIPIEAIKL